MSWQKSILAFMLVAPLVACEAMPSSGPTPSSLKGNAVVVAKEKEDTRPSVSYALVPLSKNVVNAVVAQSSLLSEAPLEWPINDKEKKIRISVGDTIVVTIYESRSGGLFVPSEAGVRPGNYVQIPAQIVDSSGMIEIPFVGSVSVVGRTATDIGQEISEKLGDRAIEPQAVVSVAGRNGSEVSVIGDVEDAKQFPLSLAGERILDAIAEAGGPNSPGYETWVTLQRDGQEWSVPFDKLVMEPSYNIPLHPDDTVYLYREPEMFQMFGASGFNGGHTFIKRDITLSEALGEANGLNDNQADPAEIYLYRQERVDLLLSAGLLSEENVEKNSSETMPVIYQLDLRAADGFFLAQEFPVLNKDIIYVANARSVELNKFLDVLGNISGTKISTHNAIEQRPVF